MGRPCICCNNTTCDSSYCINSENFENHDYAIAITCTNFSSQNFVSNKYSFFDRDFYLNDVYLGTHKKNTTCQWFTTSLSAIQNLKNYFNSSPPPPEYGYNFDNITVLNTQQKEAFFAETFRMMSEQQGVRNCLNNQLLFEFGGIQVAAFRVFQNSICFLFPVLNFIAPDWWQNLQSISIDGRGERYSVKHSKTIQNLCCKDEQFEKLIFEFSNDISGKEIVLSEGCFQSSFLQSFDNCDKFSEWPFRYEGSRLTAFRDSTYILRKNITNCKTSDFFQTLAYGADVGYPTFMINNDLLFIEPFHGWRLDNIIQLLRVRYIYPGFNELYKIVSRNNSYKMQIIQDDIPDIENGRLVGFCRSFNHPFYYHSKKSPFINVKITGI